MGQKLVIVESPAKAKTIGKYLGKNYIVEASMGHVRDLPKSTLGVDIDDNYNPKYITIRGKGELLDKLKKAAKKCDKIYLATDPDREGEAISWHLSKVLKIDESEKCRIEFNEITKNAIKTAIKCPRKININLVDAQQARRVLDRLVGYKISPILWRKVKWGLSAGRVQSVALKMVCSREKLINDFKPEEYWSIDAQVYKQSKKDKFTIRLTSFKGKKIKINNEEENEQIINSIKKDEFKVENVKEGTKNKNTLPPFTTSTLQQDANKKLNFSTKKTMSVAQQLYEGIDVKGHGTIGLITYMRTDSVRVSKEAQEAANDYILNEYGKEYLPPSPKLYKSKKNIQDAHEAIRPTYIELTPGMVKSSLKDDQYKLYNLIWSRFMASQMANCILNTLSIEIKNGEYTFRASGSNVKFEGFMRVYKYNIEEDEHNEKIPLLQKGDLLHTDKIDGKQHFTQPPARFTEASLVKTLEENGIGRPSTYAPIISTLIDRKYVKKEKKAIFPTELGNIVDNILSDYFKQIIDIEFTADMENKLDNVEEGKENWKEIVDEYFKPLKEAIDIAEKEVAKITIEDEVTDIKCDKCGRNMVIKHGRFGDFLACPGYPDCKNTKPIVEKLKVKCPKCGGDVIVRRSKKGRKFFGCSNYPDCDFVSWFEPTEENCPNCGSFMVKKFSKAKGYYLQCSNQECKYEKSNPDPDKK
ncbi:MULTISPECIES: type I DNA topoisomerase [Clostridium]|uniref:DNA topoisomerase 1 n=1 Tax=Clostridium acetobutylicum (strain ATCC 824 / DSM 792 / JCM 1419 / IAM 19013 / LMG 5710 / NBRC 13948 / NRRL B-527 / VKM B-1787 / 2291 / W) TaxID=272562 RepID=Q97I68_CLOAB|nr:MULTISPECIES: type I DNA topoisomerase [Clostridium]AAK79750.1 Topoisomerase I [Clostridium acetobutylicum ATCC 824]ADZ20835.1 DNA topoisomerase I [Clostridium acetobutylicum EA 2018]AEI33845.1 DNA topoisomerase I [Clostridium acetobutylicum DSM 1731]AWV79815.1 type I DNA topoisomerase [Clostridium acetobutylicum]MBC2394203.1 type I DNA topoisomerase [Clostridium acetobutylicum]